MIVLLIDGVGRKREMKLEHFLHTILVPIPSSFTCRTESSPIYRIPSIAEFVLSDELSYPSVYRQHIESEETP
jgi:hypothetical protein